MSRVGEAVKEMVGDLTKAAETIDRLAEERDEALAEAEALRGCGYQGCEDAAFYVDESGVAWCLEHRGAGIHPPPEVVIQLLEGDLDPDGLGAHVAQAQRQIPEGWEVRIHLKKGEAWVTVRQESDPPGAGTLIPKAPKGLAFDIGRGVAWARAKIGTRKGGRGGDSDPGGGVPAP